MDKKYITRHLKQGLALSRASWFRAVFLFKLVLDLGSITLNRQAL